MSHSCSRWSYHYQSSADTFWVCFNLPTQRTVFVGNLPAKTKETTVRKLLSKFGTIESVRFRSLSMSQVDNHSGTVTRAQLIKTRQCVRSRFLRTPEMMHSFMHLTKFFFCAHVQYSFRCYWLKLINLESARAFFSHHTYLCFCAIGTADTKLTQSNLR